MKCGKKCEFYNGKEHVWGTDYNHLCKLCKEPMSYLSDKCPVNNLRLKALKAKIFALAEQLEQQEQITLVLDTPEINTAVENQLIKEKEELEQLRKASPKYIVWSSVSDAQRSLEITNELSIKGTDNLEDVKALLETNKGKMLLLIRRNNVSY